MFCSNCGAKLPDGTKFCTNCGAPVASPTQEQGDQAAPDETVAMPSPSANPEPTREYVPISIDEPAVAPEPAAPSYASSPASRRHGGTSSVTIVMAVIAAVAVIALVVVVANPFHMGGTDAASQQQVAAEEEPADDAAEDDVATEDESKADDASAEEDDADDEASDDGASDDSSRGGDNNVVVVVGDDRPSQPTGGTVVVREPSDSYVLPNSASHSYSTSELSHLTDWELYLARNEIYARHGRRFNNDDLQRYFNAQSWYTPVYSPEDFDARSGSILSSVEQNNASTILSVEQARGSAYI